MIQVHVTDVRPPAEPGPHSALIAFGTDIATDRPIAFAGEPRMLWDMRHALDANAHLPEVDRDLILALIEDWQVVVCQADKGCGLSPAPDSKWLWCRGHERLIGYDPSDQRDEDGPWGGGFAANH